MSLPGEADEAVLDCVMRIPPGRLSTYGDVAAEVRDQGFASSARRVAAVLRDYGSQVPWWRVVPATARLAAPVANEAARRLAAEGVVVRDGRVDLDELRWRW